MASNHPATLSTRLRKNAKNLSPDEWTRFVVALKVLKARTRPGGVVSIYDEFCALHMGAVEINRNWRRMHAATDASEGPRDPAHDNPGWDWTDHEFTKKLLSPAMMGGNGGHSGAGGALVQGPFTLEQGWSAVPALHRSSWFRSFIGARGTDADDADDRQNMQQPSLGRSIVRYMGEVEDLANTADILDLAKRKAVFGPDKLVVRNDNVQPVADDEAEDEPIDMKVTEVKPMPRGTFHIGDSLPVSVWESVVRQQDRSFGSFDDCHEYFAPGETPSVPLRIRENIPGFRVSVEVGPRMHSQTHDWFGFHTTILQDDQISGASTMPNVACATVDPNFFLHHCNVDRLWAEWQDSGHYGSIFYPKRDDPLWLYADVESIVKNEPMRKFTYPDGHNLDDNMWPWNDDDVLTHPGLQEMIPCFPYTVCARDVLDYRLGGYAYDTSVELSVNNPHPVIVHLPQTRNQRTHQVFPLRIQRAARYLVRAKNTGADYVDSDIRVYERYEEVFEHTFMRDGFSGQSIPPEPEKYETGTSKGAVWELQRGRYFIVVAALITGGNAARSVEASYEIGLAASVDFELPKIPTTPGVIDNPQVPPESCVYIAKQRYAPVKLEPGRPQFRLTRMKGTHELFGINLEKSPGLLDVQFEGMEGLVQLYGPFGLDSDHLPHFDVDGKPIEGDAEAQLSARLHIATSEGCCKSIGTGVASLVTPGRYIVLVFHCAVGHREHQPYKVTCRFDETKKVREMQIGLTNKVEPGAGGSTNALYRICTQDGQALVTQDGDMFEVDVETDDPGSQKQVRVGVLAYSAEDILGAAKDGSDSVRYVAYTDAFWGESRVRFGVAGNQVLFVRVRAQHPTGMRAAIRRL
ncbi:Di-copper centre-containing protein [Pholiota conissans]|uniref:Di-copper centre-containing protein n=1 Tax=Pholiota conissans TaxID=109636 RepID=A0A9P5YNX6_9AGAR|nr:Di-copper centre-containing protein [Pholiota conissans]